MWRAYDTISERLPRRSNVDLINRVSSPIRCFAGVEERALQAERERRLRTLRLRADETRTATVGFDARASTSTGVVDKVDDDTDVQFDSQV